MKLKTGYTIVDVADDHFAIPVGKETASFQGVISLTEAASFLLRKMEKERTKEELISLLTNEFDVDDFTAEQDVDAFIKTTLDLGLIE